MFFFFFSSRRRHTRWTGDWSSDVCSSDLWGGYNWRAHQATAADVQTWALDGANIGLRAGRFPGLDIDSMNAAIVEAVKQMAFEVLGPAPVRVGKAPKALLMYRT